MIIKENDDINFLQQKKTGHLTHLEDLIYDEGYEGGLKILFFLQNLLEEFKSNISKRNLKIRIKIDGSPSLVFCKSYPGIEGPFVGTKGVFNKNPIIFQTEESIIEKYKDTPELINIFTLALSVVNDLPIPNGEIWKGDFLFSQKTLQNQNIDGQDYITFTPNTITYAIPANSDVAEKIRKSKIGIAFHTRYKGNDLRTAENTATFDLDITKYNIPDSIFTIPVDIFSVAGIFNLTVEETNFIENFIEKNKNLLERVKSLCNIIDQNDFYSTLLNRFENVLIRQVNNTEMNQFIGNDYKEKFINWVNVEKQKEIEGKKLEKTRLKIEEKYNNFINEVLLNPNFDDLIEFQKNTVTIKNIFLNKLEKTNNLYKLFHFIKNPSTNDFKASKGEGFVVSDIIDENVIKLVDRLSFSKINFLRRNESKKSKNLEDLTNQDLEDLFLFDGEGGGNRKKILHYFPNLNFFKDQLKLKILKNKIKKIYIKEKLNYFFESIKKPLISLKERRGNSENVFTLSIIDSINKLLRIIEQRGLRVSLYGFKGKEEINDINFLLNKNIEELKNNLTLKFIDINKKTFQERIRSKEFFIDILKELQAICDNLIAFKVSDTLYLKENISEEDKNILEKFIKLEVSSKSTKERLQAFKMFQLYFLEKENTTNPEFMDMEQMEYNLYENPSSKKIISLFFDTKAKNKRSENAKANEIFQSFFIFYFIRNYEELKEIKPLLTDFSYINYVEYDDLTNQVYVKLKGEERIGLEEITSLFQTFFITFKNEKDLRIRSIDESTITPFIEYFIGSFAVVEKLIDYFGSIDDLYVSSKKFIEFDDNYNILQSYTVFEGIKNIFNKIKPYLKSGFVDVWCPADVYIFKKEFKDELVEVEKIIDSVINDLEELSLTDNENESNLIVSKVNNLFQDFILNEDKSKRLLFPLSLKQGGSKVLLKQEEDVTNKFAELFNDVENCEFKLKLMDIYEKVFGNSKSFLVTSTLTLKNNYQKVNFSLRDFAPSNLYAYHIDVEANYSGHSAMVGKLPRTFILELPVKSGKDYVLIDENFREKLNNIKRIMENLTTQNIKQSIDEFFKILGPKEEVLKRIELILIEIKNCPKTELILGKSNVSIPTFIEAFEKLFNYFQSFNEVEINILNNDKSIDFEEILYNIRKDIKTLLIFFQALDLSYYVFSENDIQVMLLKLQDLLFKCMKILGNEESIPHFELS